MTTTRPTRIARRHYDAVVVGARAAGASTAMLLARRGLRVLAVDRSGYGSDTLSSHALMRGAVVQLHRWGLLPAIVEAGTPPITWTEFRYGGRRVPIEIPDQRGVRALYAPRRTVLDRLLVDAARDAGAEVHHRVSLVDLERRGSQVEGVRLRTDDGRHHAVTAGLVIGADGLRSTVARMVDAPVTRRGRHASSYIMQYVTDVDLPDDRYLWLYADHRGAGVIPTNEGQFAVFAALPPARFRSEGRDDVTGTFHRVLGEIDPEVAAVVRGATPVGPVRSFPGHIGQFRRAAGDGWALVGDAGYFKDPFAAHGISDALRDAELLADAVVGGGIERYGRQRDELSAELFDVLEPIAAYDWDLEQLQRLHLRLSKAMSRELAALDSIFSDAGTLAAVA